MCACDVIHAYTNACVYACMCAAHVHIYASARGCVCMLVRMHVHGAYMCVMRARDVSCISM